MRAGAILIGLVALATGPASIVGDAAASHTTAPIVERDAVSPTWSPGGKQLAFAYVSYASGCCGLQQARFRIVRTSGRPGGAIRTVTDGKKGAYFDFMVWASGDRILIDEGEAISLVDARGGTARRIVFPDCRAQDFCVPGVMLVSPNHEIAAVDLCGGCGDPNTEEDSIGFVTLKPGRAPVASPALAGFGSGTLAFSPDSTELVYTSSSGALMALPVAGGDPVPLAQSGIPGAALVPSDVEGLQWSPDGRWLAYVENGDLQVVPTNGAGAPRILATDCGGDLQWSPTSKLVAYASSSATPQLMTVRPDGTHRTDLLKGRHLDWADYGAEEWSPDGSRLAFSASGLSVHVWTVRANGRDLTRRG
jgi:Tol biopolymer transport system component